MAAVSSMRVLAATLSPQGLAESIARLRNEFVHLKSELKDAHWEIVRLKRELAQQQATKTNLPTPSVPKVDISSLRRQISFFCHPDRGGDNNVMSSINMLFDYLEHASLGGQQCE